MRRPVWRQRHRLFEWLHTFTEQMTIKKLLMFIFVSILAWTTYREAVRQVILIEPFFVPKQMEEAGFSSQAVANRISDDIEEIERSVRTSATKDHCLTHVASFPDVEV